MSSQTYNYQSKEHNCRFSQGSIVRYQPSGISDGKLCLASVN